jgi:hypothetical protein
MHERALDTREPSCMVVVVVVMPLLPIVFSCHKVIEMPQQSSKAGVDTSNGCLNCPKLGVGGKLCGLQHTNLLICHLYNIIKSLVCFFTSRTKACTIPFVRGGCGGKLCGLHGKVDRNKEKQQ